LPFIDGPQKPTPDNKTVLCFCGTLYLSLAGPCIRPGSVPRAAGPIPHRQLRDEWPAPPAKRPQAGFRHQSLVLRSQHLNRYPRPHQVAKAASIKPDSSDMVILLIRQKRLNLFSLFSGEILHPLPSAPRRLPGRRRLFVHLLPDNRDVAGFVANLGRPVLHFTALYYIKCFVICSLSALYCAPLCAALRAKSVT
jgi:hypothetical protein